MTIWNKLVLRFHGHFNMIIVYLLSSIHSKKVRCSLFAEGKRRHNMQHPKSRHDDELLSHAHLIPHLNQSLAHYIRYFSYNSQQCYDSLTTGKNSKASGCTKNLIKCIHIRASEEAHEQFFIHITTILLQY